MRAIFLVLYCISLFSSQLLSLPVSSSLWWNRSDFMTKIQQLKEVGTISPDVTGRQSEDRTNVWRVILSRPPPSEPEDAMVTPLPLEGESSESPKKRVVRGRRHVHSRGHHNHHHAQLMRVGCVLGTCQVQNLSHRLYQLVGQSGREDSPINPHSPHSYG